MPSRIPGWVNFGGRNLSFTCFLAGSGSGSFGSTMTNFGDSSFACISHRTFSSIGGASTLGSSCGELGSTSLVAITSG